MGKCSGITLSGEACKGRPIDNSQWCYYHHPNYVEERKRHGSKGGKRGGRGRPLTELHALKTENADIRKRLLDGELQPGVASVGIQSLNVDVRIALAALKIHDQEELVGRMEALEDSIEQQKKSKEPYYGA
jgi:hypothetical protein